MTEPEAELLLLFGERVRLERERLGLKQEELAAMIGTDVGSVSRWERGRGYPQVPMLVRLADALSKSVDYLLRGMAGRPPPALPVVCITAEELDERIRAAVARALDQFTSR